MYWAHGMLRYVYVITYRSMPVYVSFLVVIIFHFLDVYIDYFMYKIGRERWDLGMASNKPIVQLASLGSSNWEKDNLYAWGYRKVNKSHRTDWKSSASNHNGSRFYSSHGSFMVGTSHSLSTWWLYLCLIQVILLDNFVCVGLILLKMIALKA